MNTDNIDNEQALEEAQKTFKATMFDLIAIHQLVLDDFVNKFPSNNDQQVRSLWNLYYRKLGKVIIDTNTLMKELPLLENYAKQCIQMMNNYEAQKSNAEVMESVKDDAISDATSIVSTQVEEKQETELIEEEPVEVKQGEISEEEKVNQQLEDIEKGLVSADNSNTTTEVTEESVSSDELETSPEVEQEDNNSSVEEQAVVNDEEQPIEEERKQVVIIPPEEEVVEVPSEEVNSQEEVQDEVITAEKEAPEIVSDVNNEDLNKEQSVVIIPPEEVNSQGEDSSAEVISSEEVVSEDPTLQSEDNKVLEESVSLPEAEVAVAEPFVSQEDNVEAISSDGDVSENVSGESVPQSDVNVTEEEKVVIPAIVVNENQEQPIDEEISTPSEQTIVESSDSENMELEAVNNNDDNLENNDQSVDEVNTMPPYVDIPIVAETEKQETNDMPQTTLTFMAPVGYKGNALSVTTSQASHLRASKSEQHAKVVSIIPYLGKEMVVQPVTNTDLVAEIPPVFENQQDTNMDAVSEEQLAQMVQQVTDLYNANEKEKAEELSQKISVLSKRYSNQMVA